MAESTADTEKVCRKVLVLPLAARREALYLGIVIAVIVFLMAMRFSQVRVIDIQQTRPPYQLSDIYLQNQAPVLYRTLLGVTADIMDLRLESESWPKVSLLIEESLPPFANNFLPMGLRGYVWELYPHEGWVDYFGINGDVGVKGENKADDPLQNSFVLRIIDLESEDHPHPHFGEHANLSTRFVSQVWTNPKLTDYPGEELIKRGWKWIVSPNQQPAGGAQVTEK